MIEYLEIRDKSRNFIGVIDNATSIIWSEEYYGAGTFEIYTALNDNAKRLLTIGYFVTKNGSNRAGIIESVEYQDNAQDGAVIIARGRMAKSILDRRLAYSLSVNTITPQKMSGNVATAAQNIVNLNAGANASANRQLDGLAMGSTGGITKTITTAGDPTTRQSSYRNLLEFTDSVLEEYECGARLRIDGTSLYYDVFEGADHTSTSANPVIFSLDFENLLSADYLRDVANFKNFALIGGEGEGLARFFTTYNNTASGYNRREVFVDALSINRKYEDGDETKQYTNAQYTQMLQGQAQTELKEYIVTEEFSGELAQGQFKYGVDFDIGDVVTVQDNRLGILSDVRILQVDEIQDLSGYSVKINFGG